MSFSADIKNELCGVTPTQCCLKAEAFGLLLFGRSFSLNDISFMTEQKSVAMRYCDTVRTLTGVIPVISCSKAGNYKIRIESPEDRKKLLLFFGYNGKELALRVNFSNFENNDEECCFKSFIRGAFLACGSVSNPEKDYHLEFSVAKSKLCDDLMTVIEEAGLKGEKIGGAQISAKHANFIINDGSATARDVVSLIKLAKERVKELFGVDLKEEVRYLGEF